MSIVQKLTEGIINRDLAQEGAALITKWENTGLLEGIGDDAKRNSMARLLENQAKELLRESSSMSGGDVEGFAAVAFPLVRRVFGSLIANDLVSVQPMSLPSGLIFFLDFTVSGEVGDNGTTNGRLGYPASTSLYGGGVVGSEITGGVSLASGGLPQQGPYALNNAYSSPTGSAVITALGTGGGAGARPRGSDIWRLVVSGVAGADNNATGSHDTAVNLGQLTQFDPDLSGSAVIVVEALLSNFDTATSPLNLDDLVAIQVSASAVAGDTAGTGFGRLGLSGTVGTPMTGVPVAGSTIGAVRLARRLTQFSSASNGGIVGDRSSTRLLFTFFSNINSAGGTALDARLPCSGAYARLSGGVTNWSWPERDVFSAAQGGSSNALGALVGSANWGLEGNPNIPEIDIKVDSVSVTAVTKKLKAKWTPELGQDLNAYHNLDAEVELTQILSEQIALEIDREIIEDLVRGSTGATRYWSRSPGQFVNRLTGQPADGGASPPDFTGNVSEWYETLIETINDVSAQIHRKTLRGAANFVVCGPEVANILEFTAGFRANVTADSDRGDAGAVKVGSLSKKFDVIVDPYFPRQLVLVGRRGSSFLESGYVYAPYVPLQTTPTIFGVEDFVPRKGVMTRYAKKMVRPDMYGLVIIRDIV